MRDNVESFKYNLKACSLNISKSCYAAGLMSFYGKYVTPDTNLGIKCLEKACDLKDPNACLKLFEIYFMGKNVSKDPYKALE
jgi:TPR repeat protein